MDEKNEALLMYEMSVLGCMMYYKDALELGLSNLVEEDFSNSVNRKIFRTIKQIKEQGREVDGAVVTVELSKYGAGIVDYLMQILDSYSSVANIDYYIKKLKDESIKKEAKMVFNRILSEIESKSVEDIINDASRCTLELSRRIIPKEAVISLGDRITDYYVDIIDRAGAASRGIKTGFTRLDNQTSGLQPGELIIIGGRPTHGKTSLAINIAEHIAFKENKNVLFISLEMDLNTLIARILCSMANVNWHNLRMGIFRKEDKEKLSEAAEIIHEKKRFYIYPHANTTVNDIRIITRRKHFELANEGGLGAVFIDYIQIIRPENLEQDRVQQLGDISRSLKALASELQIPVVALAQLNREMEKGGKETRPRLANLRESGCLEQDADTVLLLWRPNLYKDVDPEQKAEAHLYIDKQRNGPQGMVKLYFKAEHTRFYEVEDVEV
ncbi:MAG: replicative DNA helicase [bacterium]|nr:replicative DNA helicase [bacterium]